MPDVLRRYLKAMQQQFASDTSSPLRLSDFVEREQHQRHTSHRSAPAEEAVAAPCAN